MVFTNMEVSEVRLRKNNFSDHLTALLKINVNIDAN